MSYSHNSHPFLPSNEAFNTQQPGTISLILSDVNVHIPSRHNPCLDHPKHSIDAGLYQQGMTVHWVNFCLHDNDLMQGIFHASCVDLAKMQRKTGSKKDAEFYEERALHYRGKCLRLASEAMPQDDRPMTDKVIGMALFLATNEVSNSGSLLFSLCPSMS